MTRETTLAPAFFKRPPASPRARRIMRQLGISPDAVQGSGPGGRIVEADVRKAVVDGTPANGGRFGSSKKTASKPQASAAAAVQVASISTMRRTIADRTAESFSKTPHFYLRAEADVTSLLEIRNQLLPIIEQEAGGKLTVTDFLIRAMARTWAEFPFANCIWQNNTIVKLAELDMGLVVGLPDGLLIPIIRNVDRLTLAQLVKQRSELVAAARAGKISAEATQGGATSLSNLGGQRVDEFAAVISPPQSTMLAVGRAAPRPFVVEGRLAVRTTIRLCLSADHRVMDGSPAAQLLERLVELLENPAILVRDTPAMGFE